MASTSPESQQHLMQVEERWPVIQEGIDKLIKLIEGDKTQSFSSQDYMHYYTTVYNLCEPNPTGGACEVLLYDKYTNVFKDYISSKVLPSLQEKKDEDFLKEIEKRWSDHKVMTRWLSRFFHFLDRYFVPKRKLPTLQESALLSFYNLVFGEFNNQIKDAVLSLIDREREGEDIDHQALINNIVGIYVDVSQGSTKYYERDFEETMFKATASFYSNKARNWIENESYKDYMIKVECCLKHERDTVSCYLPYASRKRLLEIVEHELMSVYETELKEKKELMSVYETELKEVDEYPSQH